MPVTRDTPYLIELIPVDRGWILEKIALEIEKEAALSPERFQVRVTAQPSDTAELTYFLPESAYRDLHSGIRVTYLAHKEDHPGAAALFEEVARKSDYCVTSSSRYKQVLEQDGAREVFKIPLGVDTEIYLPKVRIGVVGRTYHTGRKGEGLLAPSMALPFTEFVFTGEGWPSPARHYSERDLQELYQSLDYLLVPSLIEGGPVPMLEALSCGCPVIAPTDVGMVEDFPHLPFRRGDADDLRRVIQAEVQKKLALRAAALPCDWKLFAKQHLELFATLIDRRRAADAVAPGAVVARTADPGPRVALVTHGTEDSTKGGPTTRARNIAAQLRSSGRQAEYFHGLSSVPLERYDVVHVFNIWPPDSALATLAAGCKAGKAVVFSPIALDLSDWPVFRAFMERLLAENPSDAVLLDAVARMRETTPARNYAGQPQSIPLEGIPSLFENLRLCCDLADRLIFLSDYEKQFLAAIGARVDHGVLVRNGVDVDNVAGADGAPFRKKFSLERYFLCVGRLEYRKNQALAAHALRDMRDQDGLRVPLVCIGAEGDPGYANHVQRLGGAGVRLIERIEDRALLASAYAGAEAFVFPSWTEGAPLAALEAAAAGTPLLVSEMSSEREYLGAAARYFHPTDLAGLRDAAQSLLAAPDTPAQRAERSRRFCGEFSIARHAEETERVYRDACGAAAERRRQPQLVLDVSSLLHFLRIGQPFTGVPTVEWNVLRELRGIDPGLRCIVYNNLKDRFIEIRAEDLFEFKEGPFNAKYWFAADAAADAQRSDRKLKIQFLQGSPPPPDGTSGRSPGDRLSDLWKRILFHGERLVRRLPGFLRAPAAVLIRLKWPNFDPNLPLRETSSPGAIFQHPLATVSWEDAPREPPLAPISARLLSLGQSWLSNEPLLDRMLHLAATRVLSLEPYVYDLSYHTGAHFSGWDNNDDRYRRLLKLLANSDRVYTECRQVEEELQKMRAAHGFAFRTRRTGMRGRSIPEPDARGAPAYARDSFVLYVSSFNRRKNHDFLVRVWRELHETRLRHARPHYRLVLVGEMQEERKYGDPAMQEQLRGCNIDVLSSLPDAALAHLMRECAFTVYPSVQEGWGLPVQESLLCGKVCLVSDTVPVAQEVRNGALIRISPLDYYGWYEALWTWLENPAMRRTFGEQALQYAPPSWRAIAQEIYRP